MIQVQTRFDELANLPFSENRPTAETVKILTDELLFQRATQIYLWALPLINTQLSHPENTFAIHVSLQQTKNRIC
jgi:hypothetical protein